MAEMIPDYIDREDWRRNGERLVFEWLSDDDVPGTVYYSLLQKNHKHKLMGEVDFLYVSQQGFLCIEVKGGQQIYCKNKKWYSVNRKGVEYEIRNPFVQAKDCMYALKDYFSEIYGKNSVQSKYLIGYAVIFPECKFTGTGNDLVTEVMFDAGYRLDEFGAFLDNVFDYWRRQTERRHGYLPENLSKDQINQVNNLLRGDFRVVPSMSLKLQHIEQKMLKLTDEQYDVLDISDNNNSVIIQGVAGTGKTLLALEKVRRSAAKEKRVLYVCFNRNMAQYAADSLSDVDPQFIKITTFHSLLYSDMNGLVSVRKSLNNLARAFIENKPKTDRYDCLVIDEGQDLMNIWTIEVLDRYLKDGLCYGEWVMFFDPNQNIFIKSEEYDFVWEYIREEFRPVIFLLNCNCRNTEQIARRTSVLSLVPPAKHMKVRGPRVAIRTYSSRKGFLKIIREELCSLFAGGISPMDIVLLSGRKLSNSMLSSQKKLCNLEIVERNNISNFGERCLNYYTVQSFKGLESKIVFYIDVNGFKAISDRMINYVAMSRAKHLLYVFYDESLINEYDSVIEEGQELLY